MGKVHGALIALARESRERTQGWLADTIGSSQSKVSKYESDSIEIADDDVFKISEALGYTPDFFFQPVSVFGSKCFHHRKRVSLPVRRLRAVHAQMNIFRMQVSRLLSDVVVDKTLRFHEMDVDAFGGPENVARELRNVWSMPDGPVRNLTALIEMAGGIVWKTDFGTQKLDAIGQAPPGEFPLFFVNSSSPGCRLRFSLGHEIGHVLMHWKPSTDREEEADRFAAELLLPKEDIGSRLRDLSLDRLSILKEQWKVSMQALIKRASDLDRITERHYRTLFTQMSQNGWRLREPVEIPIEEPTVVEAAINVHVSRHGLGEEELSKRVFLRDSKEFRSQFLRPTPGRFAVVG